MAAKSSAKAAQKPSASAAAATAAKKFKLPAPKNKVQFSQAELFDVMNQLNEYNSRKTAKLMYHQFVQMLQAGLKKGYKFALPGVGKLQVRQTKARMGRNPATGEIIQISARKRVRLTPSKALKESVL